MHSLLLSFIAKTPYPLPPNINVDVDFLGFLAPTINCYYLPPTLTFGGGAYHLFLRQLHRKSLKKELSHNVLSRIAVAHCISSLVVSHFRYANVVRGALSDTKLSTLQKYQNGTFDLSESSNVGQLMKLAEQL